MTLDNQEEANMYYISNDIAIDPASIIELGSDGEADHKITACTGVDANGNRWSWIETNGGPFAVYEGCELDPDYVELLRDTLPALSAIDTEHAAWLETELDAHEERMLIEEESND